MPRNVAIAACFVLLGLAPTAFGQRTPPLTVQGGLGLAATSFQGDAAGAGGSLGVLLDVTPRLYRVLALRAEAGVAYLGAVCFEPGAACDAARERSGKPDTYLLSGAAAAGMLSRPLRLGVGPDGVDVAVGVFAGREWVHAGLGSGACLNCRVEGVGVRGGFFLEPTLEFVFFPGFGLGASYRTYSRRSDLRGRATVRLISRSNG